MWTEYSKIDTIAQTECEWRGDTDGTEESK